MCAGDQAESDGDCNSVGIHQCVRDLLQELEALDKMRHHGFADPAQGQADHGYAELNAVDYLIKVAVQPLEDAGADTTGFYELLDAGITHADQGELRSSEKGVCRHQEDD